MDNINTIIWDWNGTLFDDVDICIESINLLLAERALQPLALEKYIEVFDFPVKDYYQRIGFDFSKEPFEVPANQFIDHYFSRVGKAKLHHAAKAVLNYFADNDFTQLVLSASEQQKLTELLMTFNIDTYFRRVAGLDHDYATSKTDLGIGMLKALNIDPSTVCLVGDTVHDYEVANALGCKCVLVSNGHNAVRRLSETGVQVLTGLDQLPGLFKVQKVNPMWKAAT